ncbi:MAG TPA: AzlD domain-containing protein [Thermoanaerobaculia bacterium]|nr:AzlD domain-containing protein [Thermoanaerobaculia bacterium]
MTWAPLLVLAGGTYLFRVSGLLLADRLRLPAHVRRAIDLSAVALLIALAVTAAIMDGNRFAGWARFAGVTAGGIAAWHRIPFAFVVLIAAAVTALLRWGGMA